MDDAAADAMDELLGVGGRNPAERMVRVEAGLGFLTRTVSGLDKTMREHTRATSDRMDRVERLVVGRPSWTATTIISLSTALNGALLAYIAAGHAR